MTSVARPVSGRERRRSAESRGFYDQPGIAERRASLLI